MWITRRRSVAVVLGALLLTACGDGSSDSPAGPASAEPGASAEPTGAKAAAVYRGTTPCDGITRPVPTMPAGAGCEMAAWRVELHAGGRYVLTAAYGMTKPNSSDIRSGGTPVRLSGTYAAADGVLRLRTDDPKVSVRFLKVGQDVLHLIGRDDRLVVGNGAWSYTLNREGRSGRGTRVVSATYDEPGGPGGGVFEGRTPCAPELRPFTANLVSGCQRLKWRLTLRQNAGGDPAGYVSGVAGRNDATQGTWRIRRGLPGHSDAVVYELRPANGPGRLTLLLLGGRHLYMLGPGQQLLVGDEYLSYTLSRVE